jgi:peptidoglycan LD-endopeptidase CwlK
MFFKVSRSSQTRVLLGPADKRSMTSQDVLIGVFVFFGAATLGLAFLLLPELRTWVSASLKRWTVGSRSATASAAAVGQQGLRSAGGLVASRSAGVWRWLAARARWVAVASAVVVVVPLLALALRSGMPLDSFDRGPSREVNERVAAALQGEQLVPPLPLPPELFTTRELEQARPLIRYASREWALLDEQFRQRLLLVFKLMREQHGYELVLLEGYRSPQRQEQLASFGTQLTRAGAWESYHQYGLAADVAFLRDNRIVISERNAWAMRGYELYGELASSLGLTWGGSWRSLQDYGHVELRRPGVLRTRTDAASPQAGAGH